jgi:flagellar motor switch/type III secretory pathway protein FliN
MFSELHLDKLLEPFSHELKKQLCLPTSFDHLKAEELLRQFFEDETLSFKAHLHSPQNHLPHHNLIFALKADPIAQAFYVCLTPPSKDLLLEKFFGSKGAFDDERLKTGACGFLISKFIVALNQYRLFDKNAFYLTEEVLKKDSFQTLKIEISLNSSYPLVLDFYFPEAFVEAFIELYQDSLHIKKSDHAYPIHIICGSVKLKAEEFRAIKKHDLILLDENYYHIDTQKGIVRLTFQNKVFAQARLSGHALKILDFNPLPEEDLMEQNSFNPLSTISDVELDLQVEFATLKLKLKDLENLEAGQTLNIEKEQSTSCFLTLNAQKIARGDLVKVGEKMAFLVQEIHHG